jgi:hypothetical protein
MVDGSSFGGLPAGLPAGRLIVPDLDFADDMWAGTPVLWVSDEIVPDAGERWERLYAAHPETGLYPLLLEGLRSDADRPWRVGELSPVAEGAIDALTAEGVLRRFWSDVTDEDDEDVAPYEDWPGLAGAGVRVAEPGDAAREHAELWAKDGVLLGLVPAARGADALSLAGWGGPLNHTNFTQEISAVVRSWEDRFGVRVVRVGFDTLDLSVAAPPVTIEQARHIAAEHYAFCPDNIWQGGAGFEEYAADLVDADHWSFWWD